MGIVVQLQIAGDRHAPHARPTFQDAERLAPPQDRSAAANAPLDCLAGGALASRFRAWRGLSGRRYVCSVFPASCEGPLGGLPEFNAAVAIAVAADACGRRSRVSVFELCWRDGRFEGDPKCIRDALEAGASEWHVHLLAASPQARRAAINDLKA